MEPGPLKKATGTAVSYFTGGPPESNGFWPKAYPSLIFIRADQRAAQVTGPV